MWWMTWRILVHYVMDDVVRSEFVSDDMASTGPLCGGCHGEHQYTI
jgi:hypothetical protein